MKIYLSKHRESFQDAKANHEAMVKRMKEAKLKQEEEKKRSVSAPVVNPFNGLS